MCSSLLNERFLPLNTADCFELYTMLQELRRIVRERTWGLCIIKDSLSQWNYEKKYCITDHNVQIPHFLTNPKFVVRNFKTRDYEIRGFEALCMVSFHTLRSKFPRLNQASKSCVLKVLANFTNAHYIIYKVFCCPFFT